MNKDIILIIVGIWLLGLTSVLAWMIVFARKFSKNVKKGNLVKVLDQVLKKEAENTKSLKQIFREIKRIDRESVSNIKKYGLVKFNPFKELGGDHSFTLALLDGTDSGLVLTGLHTRERTRVYMRKIIKGRSQHKLSSEEEKALKIAASKK